MMTAITEVSDNKGIMLQASVAGDNSKVINMTKIVMTLLAKASLLYDI